MQDPATYFNQFPEQEILKCPRCDSSNTKFCYYNNYNLSQPRHYCKNCKRYWTKGGTLRNIPVGGATRKITKRSKRPATSTDAPAPNNSDNQQHQTSSSYLSHSLYPRMGAGGFEQIGVGDDQPKAEKSEERFAGLGSGEEMNCWSGSGSGHDWPDLAIFTPGGSGFQ